MSAPRRIRTLVATLAVLAFAVPESGGAATGVAIDIGRIEIEQELDRGGSYALPVVGVRNPGTERTAYEMHVAAVDGQEAPPVGWFEFTPARFDLAPHETRAVRVRLAIPTDAEPATYGGLLGAAVAGDAPGTRVGASAAARLAFTVKPSSSLHAWWLWLERHASQYAPWSYLVPLLLGAAFGVVRLRGSYSLHIVHRG